MLENKTILISAAGQGIGAASARACAAAGARVIATDLNRDLLANHDGVQGIETRVLDVTDGAAINALAADLPDLDALFNCAGVVHDGTILDLTDADWDFALDLNITSMVRMCRSFVPGFVQQNLRCNALCPGTIKTPSLQGRIDLAPDPVQAEKDFIARQPMGRLGTVDDLAPTVVHLLSDNSQFMTGQAVLVDGGVTI